MLSRILVVLGNYCELWDKPGESISCFTKVKAQKFGNCQKEILTLSLALLVCSAAGFLKRKEALPICVCLSVWVMRMCCVCMCVYVHNMCAHIYTHKLLLYLSYAFTLLTVVIFLKLLQVGPSQFLVGRGIYFWGCYCKIDLASCSLVNAYAWYWAHGPKLPLRAGSCH